MVKLDRRRILKHVAPPLMRAVGLAAVLLGEEFRRRRREATGHQGEFIVHESGVKPCNKGPCAPQEASAKSAWLLNKKALETNRTKQLRRPKR